MSAADDGTAAVVARDRLQPTQQQQTVRNDVGPTLNFTDPLNVFVELRFVYYPLPNVTGLFWNATAQSVDYNVGRCHLF